MTPSVDHVIVMASNLDEGVAWCEATIGVTPGPGGEHTFMGTHNRLLSIGTAEYPTAYLEIIAINSKADQASRTSRHRWFDMDSESLQAKLAKSGPQLIHWVASVPALAPKLHALKELGIDRGAAVAASRSTPTGLLQWQISIRADGQRLFDGCLPTLIEWGVTHPSDHMTSSGVALSGLHISHPDAQMLGMAMDEIGLPFTVTSGAARLSVDLQTPKGPVRLSTK